MGNGQLLSAFAVLLAVACTLGCGKRNDSPPTHAHTDTEHATLPVASAALQESERTFLWQVEHHVLLLKKKGLPQFAAAWKSENREALLAFFADGFQGRLPTADEALQFEDDFFQVSRAEFHDQTSNLVDAGALVDWISQLRRRFRDAPTIKFNLVWASPVNRDKMDGRWRATLEARLHGESVRGHLLEIIVTVDAELAAPTERNLATGKWFHMCEPTELSVASAQRPLMVDVAERMGVQVAHLHDNWKSPYKAIHTGGVYLSDVNRDGCVDLLVNDIAAKYHVRLYQGTPNGFLVEATQRSGLAEISGATPVAFVDLNRDGWEDLVVGRGQVLANEHGRFRDVTDQSNLRELGVFPCTISVADYDRDGRVDLYLSRAGGDDYDKGSWVNAGESDTPNQLLRNLGDWQFEDVTASSGASAGPRSTFTAVWLDANNDRWPDVYTIHEFGSGVLLLNQKDGTFRPQGLVEGQRDYGSMGLTAGDIDNDGNVDLYIANMYSRSGQRIVRNLKPDAYDSDVMAQLNAMSSGSELYRHVGDGFARIAKDCRVANIGWSWGAALADLNNDGWLDLHATCGFISRQRDKPDG